MARYHAHAGRRLERILASRHFRDGKFHNTAPVAPGLKPGTALPTLTEFFRKGKQRVPAAPLPSQSPLQDWARPAQTGLRATWLGHSTVLLEVDGFRVLTDPVWGSRASPLSHMGPKRFQPVPVALAALPRLDAIVVSHDHYDHLDAPTLRALAAVDVPFVTSLGVGAHLEALGIRPERVHELDWWEHLELGPLSLHAAPSQHFSGRGLSDRNRTFWSSFIVKGPRHSVFFSGDTGLTQEYAEIASRLGRFDLVMLEVGAFHPAWGDIHLGPDNALRALHLLGGGPFLPVHWGTFNLALHAWDEPAEALFSAAGSRDVQLVMPRLGQPVEPGTVDQLEPWWRQVSQRLVDVASPAPLLAVGEPTD